MILLSEKKALNPGDSAFVQIRFNEAIPACVADKFILRDYSNKFLIGGGQILKLSDEKPRGKRQKFVEILHKLEESISCKKKIVAAMSEDEQTGVIKGKDLITEMGLKPEIIKSYLKILEEMKLIKPISNGFTGATRFEDYKEKLLNIIEIENKEKIFRHWHNKAHLLSRLGISSEIGETVLKDLVNLGKIEVKHSKVQLSRYEHNLSTEQKKLSEKVLKEVQTTGITPKQASEFERDWGITEAEDILEYWVLHGELVKINQNLFLTPDWHECAITAAVDLLSDHKSFTVSEYRETLGTSRKFAIPILSHLDDLGITRLDKSERIRGSKYENYSKK